ncbi:MAG TPA: HPF/RaiA family ribosome-associated protein [Fervidobacterium sp.]|nr:30S ribosomal protein S30 [Fervidobacterium sp.]HOK87903.1 HPF/RaiA family ribosome-associated protein [Fervidobacterium sp.]HOM74245.1 HPF/RaiA family ribosome-associated protein [Fervidobacterium sp.]HOQ39455.1 HPF/RaiA family ribosome-associated protein [Fervidobacterium sp.]HPP17966.1 HPF/RaiA family ribosome-associated protein [Fervidobacterium sp.]
MEVRTFARGFELSDAMESYLEEKLEKVKRGLGSFAQRDDFSIEARFDKDGPLYVLRLQTYMNGKNIIVQEKANDVYGVIDTACDNFEKSVKREREYYKTYRKSNVRGTGEVSAEGLLPKHIIEEEDKIDNAKRVFLSNVTLEEAIEQMEVMGHTFFVFRNVDTGELNMLYRRNDKYGLLEFQE